MKIIDMFNEGIEVRDNIYDREKLFGMGYSEELEMFIMYVYVTSWVAGYYRYYKVDEEDYKLYKKNKNLFYSKYKKEIEQYNRDSYTENFIGSPFPRDYDGIHHFENFYPLKKNFIDSNVYIDGILYFRVEWEIGTFLIPPFQKIISKDGSYKFPLREICELKNNSSGNPICYYLPFDD